VVLIHKVHFVVDPYYIMALASLLAWLVAVPLQEESRPSFDQTIEVNKHKVKQKDVVDATLQVFADLIINLGCFDFDYQDCSHDHQIIQALNLNFDLDDCQ
jgi:hypothetical protein